MLVKEITRRIKSLNLWSAIYTSGHIMAPPFAQSQYFHRQLNPKKLVETGYAQMPAGTTLARYCKAHKITEVKPVDITGVPR